MARNLEMYKECAHIKRTHPDSVGTDPELLKEISSDYRILPTFEKTVFENKFAKHYSLERNELLKCRWRIYRDKIADKVFAPFTFPEIKDLHFNNNMIRFMPSLSIHNFTDVRMKMNCGPGVDYRGQMPIPYELFMKRITSTTHKEKKGNEKLKTTRKENKKKKVPEKNSKPSVDKKAKV